MNSVIKLVVTLLVSVLALSLIPISADNLVSANPTGQAWTKYPGQITMQNQQFVADAWVIKDGATYKMWFTRLLLNETEAQILARIDSMDPDLFLSDLLARDYDGLFTRASGLTAADVVALLDSATTVIGYAESANGITWTVQNANVLAGGGSILTGVGAPTVVKTGVNSYEMWYTRAESDLAVSDWTTVLGLFNDSSGAGTQANRKTAVETILQGMRTVIGHATSADGTTWADTGQVFPEPADEGGVASSVGAPCVIKDDATYKMWYTRRKSDLTESEMADAITDTANIGIDTVLAVLDGTAWVIGYATSANGTDWIISDPEVLTGNGALWDSVSDPCVVKTGTDSYHMWYTGGRTNPIQATVLAVWNELLTFDFDDIWTALTANDVEDILNAILALDLNGIKGALVNTGTDIGYASSSDGVTWAVHNASDLVGSTGSPWSSIGAPSVVESSGSYEMWFSEGINDLTVGKLIGLHLGSDLPIGRATAASPAPPPAGEFMAEATARSEDGRSWVTVPEGTTGLTAGGEPLTFITVTEMETPPPLPRDHTAVALTYTFGPEGATFDQPVAVTLAYSEADLPEGFDEANLVVVVWDKLTGGWIKLETVVDTANNTVTIYVTGFSTFTVLAPSIPASFQISNLTVMPDEVEIGEDVTINVFIANAGDLSGTYELEMKISNEAVQVKTVSLGGGDSITASFTVTAGAAGVFGVSIDGLTGRFTVNAPPVVPPPAGPDIALSNLSVTPTDVEAGETVTISALVTNRGDQEGSYLVQLKIDGVVVEAERVTLAAGESQTVTFTTSKATAGIYLADIDDLSGSFTVTKPEVPAPPGPNWTLIGGIVGGVVVIAIVVVILWLRRRAYLAGGA